MKHREISLKEFVAGVLVIAFTTIGLARLASYMDHAVTKNAVADDCTGRGQQCNAQTSNKAKARRV